MASVDTLSEYSAAKNKDYRTFRVSCTGFDNGANEITCPASTGKTYCTKCKLCSGTTRKAKDIAIKVHGSGAKKFIAAAANNFAV